MGAVKAEDKEKYYETSRTWEYDRMRAAIQSKRLAWGVAAAACTLAVASVAAVAMLSPLKTRRRQSLTISTTCDSTNHSKAVLLKNSSP